VPPPSAWKSNGRRSRDPGPELVECDTSFLIAEPARDPRGYSCPPAVIGATMSAENFLTRQNLLILLPGAIAFVFSTAGGILLGRTLNLLLPEGGKINPCIGAAGVSAVPMSARVVQQYVSEQTRGRANPLMAAMGPNVAGGVGSAVTAGVFLELLG
jgi:carboxybiotin decarboxylase